MRFGKRSSKTLLYQEVVEELYQIIDRENLEPGDQLPPERQLIEELDVSRNVLREAFHVLENRGILVSRQGKGRFLRQQPRGVELPRREGLGKNLERQSMLEAYEILQLLEVKEVELVIQNATDKDIDDLERAYQRLTKRFNSTGKIAGGFELHRMYREKCGNMLLAELLDDLSDAIYGMMYGTMAEVLETASPEWELDSHPQIIEAIRARDAQRAAQLMKELLQKTIDLLKAN